MTENKNSRNWYDKKEIWISVSLGIVIGAMLCAVTGFAVMPSMMINTFESKLPFVETVASLQKSIEENGWQVSAVMNVNKSLEKNNVQLGPKVKIIKLCHPEYAESILTTDRHISVMMPCSFAVWQGDDGKTYLSKMNMSLMADMFGGNIEKIMGQKVAEDEERILEGIVRK